VQRQAMQTTTVAKKNWLQLKIFDVYGWYRNSLKKASLSFVADTIVGCVFYEGFCCA
jgi:hypothetical protein